MDVAFGAESGRERRQGEESYLVELLANNVRLFGVADGFGVLESGVLGAPLALALTRDFLRRKVQIGVLSDSVQDAATLQHLAGAALTYANSCVFARSGSHDDYVAGGIAIAIALIVGRHVLIAHVGDTRVYLARKGRVEIVTFEDAVTIEELSRSATSPLTKPMTRHLLWNSLGTQAQFDACLTQLDLCPGDRLLLCTSGIYRRLSLEQIASALLPARDAAAVIASIWNGHLHDRDESGALVVAFDPLQSPFTRSSHHFAKSFWRPQTIVLLALTIACAAVFALQALHHTP